MADKITIDRAVVEQAIELMKKAWNTTYSDTLFNDFRDGEITLRAALDQPALAQQPAVPPGYKLLKNSTHAERSWPEDASHENGSYHCTCVNCGREFVGYKRRVVCRVCYAMLNAAPEAPAAQKEQP